MDICSEWVKGLTPKRSHYCYILTKQFYENTSKNGIPLPKPRYLNPSPKCFLTISLEIVIVTYTRMNLCLTSSSRDTPIFRSLPYVHYRTAVAVLGFCVWGG